MVGSAFFVQKVLPTQQTNTFYSACKYRLNAQEDAVLKIREKQQNLISYLVTWFPKSVLIAIWKCLERGMIVYRT